MQSLVPNTSLEILMSDTIISFSSIEAAINESNEKARARMMDLVDDGQVEPTIDCNGRWHAPCDNYFFDGRSYAGGQYLHDPDIAGSAIIKAKIVVDCSIVDRMVDLMESNMTRATCGKSWESNGSTRCYVYLEGPGRIVNLMKKLVPASGRTLVLAKEGVETGKTWVTTFGKLKSKICAYTFEPYESIEHELLRQMLEWMALSKKKTVHVEVGYAYLTYCVA